MLVPILSKRGYAMLFYDKRGVGHSRGDWTAMNLQDLANDAIACVQLLSRLSTVNKQKVSVVGHSQGGWIAALAVYNNPGIHSVVSLAGPATSVYEQGFDDEFADQICDGLDSATARNKATQIMEEAETKSKSGHFRQILALGLNQEL